MPRYLCINVKPVVNHMTNSVTLERATLTCSGKSTFKDSYGREYRMHANGQVTRN